MLALTFESAPGAYLPPPPSRRERQRVLDSLRRMGGRARMRDIAWRLPMSVRDLEPVVAPLASFDQVSIETIKPRVGRPSRVVTLL